MTDLHGVMQKALVFARMFVITSAIPASQIYSKIFLAMNGESGFSGAPIYKSGVLIFNKNMTLIMVTTFDSHKYFAHLVPGIFFADTATKHYSQIFSREKNLNNVIVGFGAQIHSKGLI